MIGVFDSGLGGLSVLAAIARALPRADLTYLADTAHVPYGDKSDDFIRGRVLAIGRHLIEQDCRMLVVACNTATAHAVTALRNQHPGVAVVGVEPGVKPAALSTASGRIAILATEATARSERLRRLIGAMPRIVRTDVQPAPVGQHGSRALHLDGPEFAGDIAPRCCLCSTPAPTGSCSAAPTTPF